MGREMVGGGEVLFLVLQENKCNECAACLIDGKLKKKCLLSIFGYIYSLF